MSIVAFADAMRAAGIPPPDAIIADGRLHRFPTNAKRDDDSGWYVLHDDDSPVGKFGDWRTGAEPITWRGSNGHVPTSAEAAAQRKRIADAERQREADDARRHAEARERATAILAAARGDAAEHSYAKLKRADFGPLVKRGAWPQREWSDALLVPMYNAQGVVQTVEAISADGDKDFLLGGKKRGAFHPFDKIRGASHVLIGEGLATVFVCAVATEWPAAAAMDAGNLIHVVKIVRELVAPGADIVIVADNDVRDDGTPNTGIEAANRAAAAIGGRVAVPILDGRKCDFWDVWSEGGIEPIKRAVASAKAPEVSEAQPATANATDRPYTTPDAASSTLDVDALLKNTKGAILPCEHNAFVLITASQTYSSLYFDEFLSRLRIDDRDWIDADDLACVRWLQSVHRVARFALTHARNGARSVAYTRRRDSLREFVEALPTWDRIARIDVAFTDAWDSADNALIRAASRNFFVALIARALKPGAQVDTVWCFEGPQGTYKSRSLRELGGAFHAEISAAIGTTDFQRELRGLWIAELSELDSLRGREASTVKRLLSAPSDRFVQKYALHAESYPRRAVAVATTNEVNYWEDPTGARRLIPIPCGDIRVDLIAENRLQWFAEARHLYANGTTWWEFPTAIADAQEDRQAVDPWEDLLQNCIAHGRKVGLDGMGREPWPEGWIPTADIMRDWLRLDAHQQGKVSGKRLASVMRRLGYRPERHGKERERGWIADTKDATSSEVSAQVSAHSPL